MLSCPICNKECKTLASYAKHYTMAHNKTKDDYLDTLMENAEWKEKFLLKCIVCNTHLRKIVTSSGRKTCSDYCQQYAKNRAVEKKRGSTQSKETIQKRIANTNQTKKEKTRQSTMYDRYGKLYYHKDEIERNKKISKALKGKSHTKEHHEKVIETKRKNGTLKHSQKTKNILKEKMLSLYESNDPPITISETGNNGRGHITGYLNEIYYRSSYEKVFLQQCFDRNIKVVSAETKQWRIFYFDENNKRKMYYPDFYLPEYDCIVEIKPESMLECNNNIEKWTAYLMNKECENFEMLTEEDIFGDDLWVDRLHYTFPKN